MTLHATGLWLIIAAVFTDVLANICLKKSDGFRRKIYGVTALALVGAAFYFFSQAVRTMDLSIAYATFGALGILLTTLADTAFFSLRLRLSGLFGILLLLAGILLLKTV